jgi:CHAT domain-containing protein
VEAVTPPRRDPQALRRLHDLLLSPIWSGLTPNDLLVIVPDGPLHALAFSALPGRHATYLVEEHPLLVAPSVAAWLRTSTELGRLPERPASAAALGNPRIDPRLFDLPNLPAAADEAKTVAGFYDRSEVAIGEAATRAAMERAVATADLVHFAGHALIHPSNPQESQLVIWDPTGSRLTAAEIQKFVSPRARLVVLAACRSIAGTMTRSDGPVGLARAFLSAGVPSVVAAHWLVDDRASRELFTVFHREFARSGDAPRALQASQRALLQSGDAVLRDAVNWAGFIAIGGAPIRAARSN